MRPSPLYLTILFVEMKKNMTYLELSLLTCVGVISMIGTFIDTMEILCPYAIDTHSLLRLTSSRNDELDGM